jgi:hypothetical protein
MVRYLIIMLVVLAALVGYRLGWQRTNLVDFARHVDSGACFSIYSYPYYWV